MLIASLTSFGYRLVFLLHMVTVIIAFAPAFVWPMLNRQRRVEGKTVAQDVTDLQSSPLSATAPVESAASGVLSPIMHGGALVLTGLFGIALIGLSSKFFAFDQTWVSIAFVLWFLMLGVFFAGLVPAQRALRQGKAAAEQRVAMFYGGMHLLLLLQIVDMIWKPGL